jgi:lipopolysaccharide export system permease protein
VEKQYLASDFSKIVTLFKILDRYILQKFIGTFVFLMFLLILIFLIFDLSENIDKFLSRNAPVEEIVFDYYLNSIPFYLSLVFPLFVFLSVIFFTSKMANRSEIIPILGSGVGLWRLARPYLVGSAMIASFFFVMIGYVLPPANKKRMDFMTKYVRDGVYLTGRNAHLQIAKGKFIYFESFQYPDSAGFLFSYEEIVGGKLKRKFFADRLQWDAKRQEWKADQYYWRIYLPQRKERIERGATTWIKIPLHPNDVGRSFEGEDISTLTTPDLKKFIALEELRGREVSYLNFEVWKRLTAPATTLVLTLIGLALSARKKRGGIGLNLAVGIGLCFSYILLDRFSSIFAANNDLPVVLAAWIPTVFFGIVAYFLVRFAPK